MCGVRASTQNENVICELELADNGLEGYKAAKLDKCTKFQERVNGFVMEDFIPNGPIGLVRK